MTVIKAIRAREILDSRGYPTLEVQLMTDHFVGVASVPEGASRGKHEAKELRDGGKRYSGLGVRKAIEKIHTVIAPILIGIDCSRQHEIDSLLIKKDGSQDKHRLGANAILAVSLACAQAAAAARGLPLYEYLAGFPQLNGVKKTNILPRPYFNVINGGKHADNRLSVQEFMIVPHLKTFRENLRAGAEVYHTLRWILEKKYGKGATAVGDEGGFAPPQLRKTEDVLQLLNTAIAKAGYHGKVDLALDCAASTFFRQGKYDLDGRKLSAAQLLQYYQHLIEKYKLISIEDPFQEEDFASFARLRRESKVQVVGDDLTVTNPERIQQAIDAKSCNCLLLKVNQIGTLTEALTAAKLAFDNGWKVMVSHRSGETEDTFIADLAVALGCGQIKAGAPCRGERVAKYNRLLLIEEMMDE